MSIGRTVTGRILSACGLLALVVLSAGLACGPTADGDGGDTRGGSDAADCCDGAAESDGGIDGSGFESALPYAAAVEDFSPGEGAGFGSDRFPEIVLGPPKGRGTTSGSLDVLSLGVDGEITVSFGDRAIEDGPGADFIVYENPFYGDPDDPGTVFEELGEVSVSADGEDWKTYSCDEEPESPGTWPGCAGWNPVLDYDPEEIDPPEPEATGGDSFDLADVGLERVRYVRIRDRQGKGGGDYAGFDLDAVGIANPVVE